MRKFFKIVMLVVCLVPGRAGAVPSTSNWDISGSTITVTKMVTGAIAIGSGGSINVSGQNSFANPTTFASSVTVNGGVFASSITLGSSGKINVDGQNYFSLPTTFVSSVTVKSSTTSSGFFGDGYGLFNFVVLGSSQSAATTSIASTIFVGVATATVVMRGSRPTLVITNVEIDNLTASQKDYTCRVTQNGVAIGEDEIVSAVGTTETQNSIFRSLTSTAGTRTFAMLCKSTSGTGTQIVEHPEIFVLEF